MKTYQFVFIGLIILVSVVVAVIVQLPAYFLGLAVANSCVDQCRIAETSGTVWQGSGNLFVRENEHSGWINVGLIHWQSDFAALASATINIKFKLNDGSAQLTSGWRNSTLHFEQFRLPAAVLLGRLGNGMPITGWGGWFVLNNSQVNYDRSKQSYQLQLDLLWQQAQAQIFQDAVLGSYHIVGSVNDQQGQMQLTTESGDLQLNGQVMINKSVKFVGTARAPSNSPLERSLQNIAGGKDPVSGAYQLRFPP